MCLIHHRRCCPSHLKQVPYPSLISSRHFKFQVSVLSITYLKQVSYSSRISSKCLIDHRAQERILSITDHKQVVLKGGPASFRVGQLKNDAGQLVLSFDNSTDDGAIVTVLNAHKEKVQEILGQHDLELTSIRRGSVVIQFRLPHSSKIFDTVAQRRTIQDLADKLLSNESFRRFRQGLSKLRIEFLVKAKLEHITGKIHLYMFLSCPRMTLSERQKKILVFVCYFY